LIGKSISYFADGISKVVSNYSNLTCKIHLTCDDQVIRIDTELEQIDLNEQNLQFTDDEIQFLIDDLLKRQKDKN